MYKRPSTEGYTIYTKSNCGACEKTKLLLPDASCIDCEGYLEDVDEFLDFIWSLPQAGGAKAFPIVFKDGKFIGGYNEIVKDLAFKKSDF